MGRPVWAGRPNAARGGVAAVFIVGCGPGTAVHDRDGQDGPGPPSPQVTGTCVPILMGMASVLPDEEGSEAALPPRGSFLRTVVEVPVTLTA